MTDLAVRITEILRMFDPLAASTDLPRREKSKDHPAAELIVRAAEEHYRPQLDITLIERMAQAIWDEMRPYKDWSRCPDKHVYRHAARGVFHVLWPPGADK